MTNHSDKSKRLLPDSKNLSVRAQSAGIEATFEVFETIDSTQTYLLNQPVAELSHGRTVLAGVQTAGRGRLDRTWSTGEGEGLLMSTVVRLPLRDHRLSLLPMAVGVGVAQAVAGYLPRVQLKWPNDVVVADEHHLFKLGGIVIALHPEGGGESVCVIGIGLNLMISEADRPIANARSLADFITDIPEIEEIAVAVLAHVHSALQGSSARILQTYSQLCCTLGRAVKVELPNGETFEGLATAIAPDGGIEVTDGKVTKTFRTADIQHLFTA